MLILGDSCLKIIYLLRGIELFIEHLLVPDMELGPGVSAKTEATTSVPSRQLSSGGGIFKSLE